VKFNSNKLTENDTEDSFVKNVNTSKCRQQYSESADRLCMLYLVIC